MSGPAEEEERRGLAAQLAQARARIFVLETELARLAPPAAAPAGKRELAGGLARRLVRSLTRRLRRALVGDLARELAELRAGQERIECWCGLRGPDGEILPAPRNFAEALAEIEVALA
ncbi:MAG: hypothetical protein ACP5NI_11930, partial [Acetobacteraceae bacterium]